MCRSPQGKPQGYIVVFVRDETSPEEEEPELSAPRTEDRTYSFVEAEGFAQIGTWEWDLRTGEVTWSEGMYRICGLAPETSKPGVAMAVGHAHPEDRASVQALLQAAVAGFEVTPGQSVTTTYRIVRDDGSIRHVRCHG